MKTEQKESDENGKKTSSKSRFDTIATGNWGCGAFNGDVILKVCIQWLAASMTGRCVSKLKLEILV